MAQDVNLLIVDPDVNYRTDLKKQLMRAGINVVGEAGYGADALSMAQGARPDAVAVAWQEPTARIEQTLESLALSLPNSPLIAYSALEDLASARRAIHAGASDYLTKPMDAKDIQDAIHKALAQIERRRLSEAGAAEAVGEGVVIAVFGAKGGIGKTTLSTNLAAALTQMRNESVALLDIDTRFGDVALVLNVEPTHNVGDAVRVIDDVNRFNIDTYLTHHASGVEILAAPTRPSEWRQVKPEHIEKLIRVLAQTHDYVVLDTPGFFTELVGIALDMADLVLLVTTMDISSIKDSSMALDMLSGADYPMERVKLVVNHPTNLSKVKVEQLQEVTGCEVFWTIPFDKNFVKSSQEGAPIVMARANSGGARSIAKLAQAIGGGGGESRLFRRRQKQEPRTEVFATQELSGERTS